MFGPGLRIRFLMVFTLTHCDVHGGMVIHPAGVWATFDCFLCVCVEFIRTSSLIDNLTYGI